MRLQRISVTGLFGIFDHDIPLNLQERITIIHGLNGYGKTVILQMIHEVLTGRYDALHTVPFTRFELGFDDGTSLRVEKASPVVSSRSGRESLRIVLTRPGQDDEEAKQIAPEEPKQTTLREALYLQLFQKRARGKHEGSADTEPTVTPGLRALREGLPVRLVQTQRLLSSAKQEDPLMGEIEISMPTVQLHSEALAREIQAVLAKYAARSQELDRTFPTRLLEQHSTRPLSFEEFQSQLAKLEEHRSQLTALGLLDPEQDLGGIPRTEDLTKLSVLSIYIQDVKEKLAVFDELAAKIELLMGIVNERFRYKKLSIDRQRGLLFTAPDGRPLPASALSSGEQHELVLLFELLFRVQRDSVVLIDEPEISLHLTWQQQFLNDLMRVVALSGFDVIIATHSADVIGEHWGLTVQLQGPPT
ncbi:MAG TPA: AAA family ATPase [Candidatus Nanopelagicales bacterium]|nr:AAA family ATPase [Candidatus Nanopelagicales bacterium]